MWTCQRRWRDARRDPARGTLIVARAVVDYDFSGLIVAVAARQDRAAFSSLFEHFAPRVKSYLTRSGASAESAEELAQETLLAVWRKASFFDPARGSASTWIFTIARNLRSDALRRERHPEALAREMDEPVPPRPADVVLAAAEREARVREAMTVAVTGAGGGGPPVVLRRKGSCGDCE